ncbi:trem-like transcript 1 protein [Perognathus longimembris pacificus]|uniref:trem-like transcript 1 protein n=1 Tax=Perognathus longimembris pacificus TaxID=214514 RepID=UPI002019D26B|nr:trem-like transcript 1 protein [Perognathus longimembris pacificus]
MFPALGPSCASEPGLRTDLCPAMLHGRLLLLLLSAPGWGWAGSLPEVLQAPVGGAIQVQCHYPLQEARAPKVWCRFSPTQGCQPLGSSAVDRRGAGSPRTLLTDMGGGLLQVQMGMLREDDAGEYGCVADTASGPLTLHTIALQVLPTGEEEEEEEDSHLIGSLAEDPSLDPTGSAKPGELSQHSRSLPLIWGAGLLLSLLVVAVVLFALVARRKGNKLGVCGRLQKSRASGTAPSSVIHHISDSGPAVTGLPSDMPYVRLDSPPSFDSLPLDPPVGKSPLSPPASGPAPPPKVLMSSKAVTYATVIFPGGDKDGGAPRESAQDPPSSQTPPS